MSRYPFSRSSDQDSSPRKKTRAMYSDSSDEELEFSSRRSVSQRRRKRLVSESRSDILTQIHRQLLSPDESTHRRGENTRNVLSRIEEEPDGPEYHGGGRKVVSSRRHSNSIQSSPYHLPSQSQEHEDVFRRPLSRVERELGAESLSWRPGCSSQREFRYDDREKIGQSSLERRMENGQRGHSLSRWSSRTSLTDIQYEDKPSRAQAVREHRAEDEQRMHSLSRWPSRTSLRDIQHEDEPSRAQAVREHRFEDEQRVHSLSQWPSRTSLRDIQYEDKLSRTRAVREHRFEDEQRAHSLSQWPSCTSLRDIQYKDKPSRTHAVREHRKESLQRIQPLRSSSRDRIRQLPSSHHERVQSVEDSLPNSSVLRDFLPSSRSLPRPQEERTQKRVPHTLWSSDSDSPEPVTVKESSQLMRQDPRTLILPEDSAACQSQDRGPSPSILLTERLQRNESVQSGSVLRSIGVQTEQQFLSPPTGNRISPNDSDSSLCETLPRSKRRKKSPKARTATDTQSVENHVSSSPSKQRNDQERSRYSTRSKHHPEAGKKSILSKGRSFSSDRKEYTDEERKQIVAYIVQNSIHEFVKGNTIWKAMFVDKVCDRSWQSMKAQFLKSILPNIKKYNLSSEELLKFKDCEKQSRINKDEKGKVVPGHRGWRRNGHYYTVDDDKKLLEYITTKRRHQETNGVKLWKMMELRAVLPERSWQSMKERYRKVILPNLRRYDVSKDDYAKLTGLTRKSTNSNTSTVPTAVRIVTSPNKKHQLHTRGHSPYVNQTYGDAAESTTESFESISLSSIESATGDGNVISTPTRKAFRALYEKAGKKLSPLLDKPVSNTVNERPERTSPVKSAGDLNTVCSTQIRSPVSTKANTPSNQMNSFVKPSLSHSEGGKAKTPEDSCPTPGEISPPTVNDEKITSPGNNDSCNKSSPHKLYSKQPQSCGDLLPSEHSPGVVEKGNTSEHDLQLSVSVNINDSNKNLMCSENKSPSVSEASTVLNESLVHEEDHCSQITSHQKSTNLDIPTLEEGEGGEGEEGEDKPLEGSNKMQMPKRVDTSSRSDCDKKCNVKSPSKRKGGTPEERKKRKEWMKRMIMRQKIVMTPIRPLFLRRKILLGGNKKVSENDGKQKDVKKRKKKRNNLVHNGKTLVGDVQAVSMNSKGTTNESGRTSTGSKVVPKLRSVSGKLRKSAVQNGNHSKRRKILAGDLTKKQKKQVRNESRQDVVESVTRAESGEGENTTVQPVETNQPLEESELPPCLSREQEPPHIPDMEDGGAVTNLCESPAVRTNLDPLEECSPLARSSSSCNSVPWGFFRPSGSEQSEVSCLANDGSVSTDGIGKYREKTIVFISESSESSNKSTDEECYIRAADGASQVVRETSPEINTQVISVCGTQIIDVCGTESIDTCQVDDYRMQLCSTCLACERSDAEGVVLPSSSCCHHLQESPGDSDGEDDNKLQEPPGDSDSEGDHQVQSSPRSGGSEDEEQSVVLRGGASMPYLSTIRPYQSHRTPLINSYVEERRKEYLNIRETSGDKDEKNTSNQCSVS